MAKCQTFRELLYPFPCLEVVYLELRWVLSPVHCPDHASCVNHGHARRSKRRAIMKRKLILITAMVFTTLMALAVNARAEEPCLKLKKIWTSQDAVRQGGEMTVE